MKNIPTASLLALGMLSFVLAFAIQLNKLDAQSIFRTQTALADETTPINIFGIVREGEAIDDANPTKSGVDFELSDGNGVVINTATSDDRGNYSFLSVLGSGSVCIVVPDGYRLLDVAQCQAISPTATSDVTLNDFTLSAVAPEESAPQITLNILGLISADEAAQTLFNAYGPLSVELRNASGTVVSTAMTDRGGNYSFSVNPENYTVCIVIPGGFGLTSNNECQPVDFSDNTDVSLGVFLLSTLPQITRNGEGVIAFTAETPYVDAGASAQKDGRDLTDHIVITGLPDVNVPGTYVISYAVVDPVTHLGATTSRVVTVQPKVVAASSGGTVLGGYAPRYVQSSSSDAVSAATTTASSSLLATSTPPTRMPPLADDESKKILKAELRKRAMGAVLGAETVATSTLPQNAIVVSTTALEDASGQKQTGWGYTKTLLALLAFGSAISGIWWWKKHAI